MENTDITQSNNGYMDYSFSDVTTKQLMWRISNIKPRYMNMDYYWNDMTTKQAIGRVTRNKPKSKEQNKKEENTLQQKIYCEIYKESTNGNNKNHTTRNKTKKIYSRATPEDFM